MESWEGIQGHCGYLVNDVGQIKSVKWGKERIRKITTNKKGYCTISLDKKTCQIHRLVAIAFIPNPEGLPQVNHKDGDKANNCVSNLEWISNYDNLMHSFNKLGREGGKSVIKATRVLEVVELYKSGKRCKDIASMFGVSSQSIHAIVTGKTYPKIKRDRVLKTRLLNNSKISVEDVKNMRRIYDLGGITIAAIARRFGVSRYSAGDIVNRRTFVSV